MHKLYLPISVCVCGTSEVLALYESHSCWHRAWSQAEPQGKRQRPAAQLRLLGFPCRQQMKVLDQVEMSQGTGPWPVPTHPLLVLVGAWPWATLCCAKPAGSAMCQLSPCPEKSVGLPRGKEKPIIQVSLEIIKLFFT